MKTLILFALLLIPGLAFSIELNPSKEQIKKAVQEGKAAVRDGYKTQNRFGLPGSCGWGTLGTKISDILFDSYSKGKKFKEITQADINKHLKSSKLIVSYAMCHDRQEKQDIHIVLKQGEKVLQPFHISVAHPKLTSSWPNSPAYRSFVAAFFPYESFDPTAKISVIVVPPIGEKTEYALDLSDFK